MSFDKISITPITGGGTPITLNVDASSTDDKYQFKGMEGAGPPDFDIYEAPRPSGGSYMQRMPRARSRDFVIRVGLNNDWDTGETVQKLRDDLYKVLSSPQGLFLMFYKADVIDSFAIVAKKAVSPVIFAKDPEVLVTLYSPEPYLRLEDVEGTIATPGSSPNNITIPNPGTVPQGFLIQFVVQGTPSDFDFYSDDSSQHLQLENLSSLVNTGDYLFINTAAGERDIYRDRAGAKVSLLGNIYNPSEASWIEVPPGGMKYHFNSSNFYLKNWSISPKREGY